MTAQALDLKGIEVDKPADCAHIASISGASAASSCESSKSDFLVTTSFLGAEQTMLIVRTQEREVSTVYLNGFDFDQAEVAFTAKFGKPKAVDTVIQNALGAKFSQRRLVWESATARLRVDRHGDRIGSATAMLDSKRELLKSLKHYEQRKGDI